MARRAQAIKITDNSTARKTKSEIAGRKKVEEVLQTIPSSLECPAELKGIARSTWEEIVRLCTCTEYKFLNDLDRDLLKVYCESVERYELASKKWRTTCKKQIEQKDVALQKTIDKCLLEMSRAGDEILKYARALNLTSAERERIAVANGKFEKRKKSAIMGFVNDE